MQRNGFTILEVVLTMSILMTLSIFATEMIKGGLDMREALSSQSRVTNRLAQAMARIAADIEQAFILDTMDDRLRILDRVTKAIFRTKLEGRNHELALTTMTHRSTKANSHESDQTYVVYRLVPKKNQPDVTDLYRGETPIIPDNFREDVPMKPLATYIKTLVISNWNGEKWDKDRWDTDSSDWRNHLPHMVMIEIEGWEKEAVGDGANLNDSPTVKLNTVVSIEKAYNNKELRTRSQTIKWY